MKKITIKPENTIKRPEILDKTSQSNKAATGIVPGTLRAAIDLYCAWKRVEASGNRQMTEETDGIAWRSKGNARRTKGKDES